MVAPAHKVTGDEQKPGQLRNETHLAEYIARKSDDFNYHSIRNDKDAPQKLSFDKWWDEHKDEGFFSEKDIARDAWSAGQENA